ncbi:MAG: hypothetical protein JG776_2438 [Caloramator sp.]|jgi:hypothetical protein|uniref:DUF5050 domain-containing protein n=1 Tax=Caloramator sp. TaxID=1871330 RepID=UPI001E10C395|nr:DUF5050 domain-containing protein [Caloramator sp.]MBZ4664714.1 hypothetical protein [Caloramator sp.]
MENRGKKIERMYYILAGILLGGFLFSYFSKGIKDYFVPKLKTFNYQVRTRILKQEDFYTNYTKNQVVVGDTIYFVPALKYEDFCLYAYNTKNKTLEMITKNWVNQVEAYEGIVYFRDVKDTLYRLNPKNKSIEKLFDNCADFQIVDNKIAYLNSENRNVILYDISNKTNIDLKIYPHKFLYMGDVIYYYFADGSSYIYEMNIKDKTYKTYRLQDPILNLMYYNGYFYTSVGNIKIVCFNNKFEKLWEIADQNSGIELSKILKGRVYYYSLSNREIERVLMSVDLEGKNPREELKVNGITYNNVEFIVEGNKDYIYDIKNKKKYEFPGIKPVLFYYPNKKEIDTLQGYRMVKVNNKLFYSDYVKLIEHKLGSDDGVRVFISNNLKNIFVKDLKAVGGNLFFYGGQLYSFDLDSNTPNLVTNILTNRMFVDGDTIYIFSITNLYRIYNNKIERLLENAWVLYIGNGKIYYYPNENGITNGTKIMVLDTKTNKTEEIKNDGVYLSEILYINDKNIYYVEGNNLWVYNFETKEKNILHSNLLPFDGCLVLNEKIFFIETNDNGKFKIKCLDINTNKLTTVVEDIGYINSYLYDEKEKKLYYTISDYYKVLEVDVKWKK